MRDQRYRAVRLAILAALGLPVGCGIAEEPYNPPTKMDPPPGTTPATVCDGATWVLTSDGFYTGFAQCPDGTVHRVEEAPCDASIPGDPCGGDEQDRFCEKNSDCTDGPYGRCVHNDAYGNLGTSACECKYACAQDSDCGEGKACVCKDVVRAGSLSTCVNAGCLDGAACASGECGLSAFFNGCFDEAALGCRADTDICRLDGDCAADLECAIQGATSSWDCVTADCVSGRPLVVDGAARTASPVFRDDWRSAETLAGASKLEPELRAAISAHYQRIAALEHASIASFARFTLELLALGAPPDLIADTQRAAIDEVEHARLAYSFASAFEGRALGPGPLDVRGVAVQIDRAAVLRALVEEACVGETLAAAEVELVATGIVDPVLRRAHQQIAEDELRHATLGWRALAFLLEGADAATLGLVAGCFEAAIAAASKDPEIPGPEAPAFGLVSGRELGEIRRAALRDIVRPCLRGLLARLVHSRERTASLKSSREGASLPLARLFGVGDY